MNPAPDWPVVEPALMDYELVELTEFCYGLNWDPDSERKYTGNLSLLSLDDNCPKLD